MATTNRYDAVDVFKRTYAITASPPPLSIIAYGILDKSHNTILSSEDVPNTLSLKTDIVQPVTPLTGATVTATALGANETAYVTPAGTIAALTYVFPTDATSRIGQVLRLVSTQIVTALTVTSTSLTLVGTAVTALAVNTPVVYQKVAAATWLRLS